MTIALPRTQARPIVRGAALTAAGIAAGLLGGLLLLALVATRFFDYQVLTVSTDSMRPAIDAGDLIIVRPVAINDVSSGDVVLFVQGGDNIPTIHRVAGVNEVELRITDRATGVVTVQREQRLVTQGDNNPAPDRDEVTAEQLRGELWLTIPQVGAFLGAGLVVWSASALGVILLGWAVWELRERRRRASQP
ncbi:MAG: signal peptidase I [Dehalococcoidia bacterium]